MAKRAIIAVALAAALSMGFAGGTAYAAGDLAALANGGETGALSAQAAKPAKPTKKQLKAFKKASADFAIELFQRCVKAKGANANVCIAPLSIENALALAANGASGKTLAQMRKVLGDGASMAQINKNLSWYNSKLVNTSRATIRNANSIWYHNDGSLKMRAKFLSAARKYYAAEVNPVDFEAAGTVAAINDWVAAKTENMIKRVIQRLDADDRIVLLNALYFDAKWKVPFEADATRNAKFTNAAGKKRTVKMMHGTESRYIQAKGVKGFIKPYAKGYSYVALLPSKGTSLKKYVASLTGDRFRKLVNGAKEAHVIVAMPKYSLDYTNEGMSKQLGGMGLGRAFAQNADFTKMALSTAGNIYIGEVVHKTRIDVDEEGTKAAAVTAIMMKCSSALLTDVKRVTLNRPFVYAIVDNTTKLPVFIGTANDIK